MPDFKYLPLNLQIRKTRFLSWQLRSNLDTKPIMNSIRTLVSNKKPAQLQEVFNDVKIVVAYKQSKHIKRLLTLSQLLVIPKQIPTKIFSLRSMLAVKTRCNLCFNGDIQECSSFKAANGIIWNIKCNINCNSTDVLYYLKRKMCNGRVTDTGKTKTKLRLRTNNHVVEAEKVGISSITICTWMWN